MARKALRINEHELAVEVSQLEGGAQEANIAEISQIVNVVLHVLAQYPLAAVKELLDRNRDCITD
jgi:hypothetical protein